MTDNEIPAGTRAVVIIFNVERGNAKCVFDLYQTVWSGKTLSELTMIAIHSVIALGDKHGKIHDYKIHFVS